jgi:hypothetical protein
MSLNKIRQMTIEERNEHQWQLFIEAWSKTEKEIRTRQREFVFLKIINGVVNTIIFIVCIPAYPIIAIINAIKDN